MKKIIFFFLIFFILFASDSFAQRKPSLNFTVGLAFPSGELDGDLVFTNDSGISFISSDFVKENYGAAMGATLTGMLKFPIEKTGILNGNFMGSYSYFNAFRRSILATTIENNLSVPVTYDSRFTASTFGLGIEITPVPDAKLSPFINADFTLNILSMSISKNDFNYAFFSDAFRMGLLTNAGVSIRFDNEYSIVVGGSYHLSNLFLKSSSSNYNDRVEFNRENIPINDETGIFYSNLSNPNAFPEPVSGSTKHVNWWSFNIGLNIVLGKSTKK